MRARQDVGRKRAKSIDRKYPVGEREREREKFVRYKKKDKKNLVK